MRLIRGRKYSVVIGLFCLAATLELHAQSFSTLLDFDGANGATPTYMSLVQGIDGNLYGTTRFGGDKQSCHYGCGTVFRMSFGGEIWSRRLEPSMASPDAGLTLASDGNLYGTTPSGGENGAGTVFEIDKKGKVTTLYSFCAKSNCRDGAVPVGSLVQGINNSLYGVTQDGGRHFGVVFEITTTGAYRTLYKFCAQSKCLDGSQPFAGVIQALDGNFYGTTGYGGTNGAGTIFKITPDGILATLYNFCAELDCEDGEAPEAPLLQTDDGAFYGSTVYGGANGFGNIFKFTADGTLVTLHTFRRIDGSRPTSALIQGTDGNLYGTAGLDGPHGCGTIFSMTLDGTLSTLHAFNLSEGCGAYGALLQATDGNFYGATYRGGNLECESPEGCGTAFRFSMGFGPFVSFARGFGNIGQVIGILGQGLTGTTSVNFNGVPVSFTVKSDTYLVATVPPGATTGYVTVMTPTGTLTSNKKFVVLP